MSAKNNVQNGVSSRAGVKILQIFFLLCCGVILMLPVISTAAVDDWSVIEEEAALEQRAREVNEGELQLLDRPPEEAAHHHQNRLMITERSLRDGWVTMYQCHSNLDKVSASQIVYNKERIRNIKVLSSQNIGSVRVEGHTDKSGSEAYNQRLSETRAEAVKTALMQRGIIYSRIQTIGFGENMPISSDPAVNRRVNIVIVPVEKRT